MPSRSKTYWFSWSWPLVVIQCFAHFVTSRPSPQAHIAFTYNDPLLTIIAPFLARDELSLLSQHIVSVG